jgi:hypothetical protein
MVVSCLQSCEKESQDVRLAGTVPFPPAECIDARLRHTPFGGMKAEASHRPVRSSRAGRARLLEDLSQRQDHRDLLFAMPVLRLDVDVAHVGPAAVDR